MTRNEVKNVLKNFAEKVNNENFKDSKYTLGLELTDDNRIQVFVNFTWYPDGPDYPEDWVEADVVKNLNEVKDFLFRNFNTVI